ncbi:MAG: SAM-dependent methyltransferase, partial [Chloroflexi bacterium CG23_combo_of_CG06-09_8_20_14_all_45_10]
MNIDTNRVRDCLRRFDFRALFIEELAWNICNNRPIEIQIDTQTFRLTPFAEQGGMVIYLGESPEDGSIPPSNFRKIIETRITRQTHEHMIVFVDKDKTRSVWQWVRRGGGRQTATREHTYHKGQPGDSLLQKLDGIAFNIEEFDDEGNIAVIKVLERVAKAFDIEKVTKRFYDEFKTEHGTFCKFLKGLEVQDEIAWYASVMLDRLMFIYFIQKKGFLDGDTDYLPDKLKESEAGGANQFYRKFLIQLFFEGFAREERERPAKINQLLGKVPYLNGGLFLPHQLEIAYGERINISDAAFERLFAFFDRYSWHLDYRPLRADNEINPDVLGYIFEKYVNQKQMGAYYTKEDITDYICKNTIIPFLFDKLENMRYEELHPFPVKDVEPYIYEAVKQEDYLPTETEREYQARQKRYQQIKADFAAGKITSINDLITYNLDIRKFAEDWARGIKDPVTLRAFYFHCLTKATILDPAVGSGAFLFAALNMLEPLYEICLDKMEELGGPKYPDFAEELARIRQHPNRKYFVLKSIIVNNLFGVDIMEEAVEICKLRLFLKLVSQVDDVDKIEPLPDIDFNIRAGNSLVGYVNEEEIKKAKATQLDLSGAMKGVEQQIEDVDRALKAFRNLQTRLGIPASELAKAKAEVKQRLAEIQKELNRDLAAFYGARDIRQFVKTHCPFHWFVEFYSIMKNGGFDVIIGNPPYVEYGKIRKEYTIQGYETESCGNTYAFFTERSIALLRESGRYGMIVQLPIVCTDRMKPLQKLCLKKSSLACFANFDDRPARLFDGLEHIRACIFTLEKDGSSPESRTVFTTTYNRWYTEDRPTLFRSLSFVDSTKYVMDGAIPKIGDAVAKSVRQRVEPFSPLGKSLKQWSQYKVYFHNSPQYWIRAMTFVPYFWNERDGEHISTQVKSLYLATKL